MSKLEVVYRRFFQFWLISQTKIISHAQKDIISTDADITHTSSEEEKILYLQKFLQNIRKNNEGPQLLKIPLTSMRFIASCENFVPRFQTSSILPFPPQSRNGLLILLKKLLYGQCWRVFLQFLL